MQCRVCHQTLSPAEALKHEEQEREFEEFERACQQWRGGTLEDVDIPDQAPSDVHGMTMLEDGTLTYPASWMQPLCDRCHVLDVIETVFYGWDGSYAYNLMHWYADGAMGCPKSPVMAYSWGLVSLHWVRPSADEEDGVEASDFAETMTMLDRIEPLLTAEEYLTARGLAEEVCAIAFQHGAIWV